MNKEFFSQLQALLSFALGCGICFLPQLWFAKSVLTPHPDSVRTAKQVRNAFYYGESIKFLITAGLCALAFSWTGQQAPAVLFGFISTQLVYTGRLLISLLTNPRV